MCHLVVSLLLLFGRDCYRNFWALNDVSQLSVKSVYVSRRFWNAVQLSHEVVQQALYQGFSFLFCNDLDHFVYVLLPGLLIKLDCFSRVSSLIVVFCRLFLIFGNLPRPSSNGLQNIAQLSTFLLQWSLFCAPRIWFVSKKGLHVHFIVSLGHDEGFLGFPGH